MNMENSVFSDKEELLGFVKKNYNIFPRNIEYILEGSAKCYKIQSDSGEFFLKEVQSKYTKLDLNHEIMICKLLSKHNIPTSSFVKNTRNNYICEKSGHCFHLQRFIEGTVYKQNTFNQDLKRQSAHILARINKSLKEVNYLGCGFQKSWFEMWNTKKDILKYENIIHISQEYNISPELKDELVEICRLKIDLLQNACLDIKHLQKLTMVNSHGDYNNNQLICDNRSNRIKAVIDFTGATRLPAVWEIIRSYTLESPECRNGNYIDELSLLNYTETYFSEYPLSSFDLENMALLYYVNLMRSSYGLSSNNEKLIKFGIWRTRMCKYLHDNYLQLGEFLKQHINTKTV